VRGFRRICLQEQQAPPSSAAALFYRGDGGAIISGIVLGAGEEKGMLKDGVL
jgi:hypothetical protein